MDVTLWSYLLDFSFWIEYEILFPPVEIIWWQQLTGPTEVRVF
jgi:hypothetical protein